MGAILMNTNPINLTVRFFLEIAMLISLSLWGWHLSDGVGKYMAAVFFPLTAAVLWGVFRISNDPKPAPVKTPGLVRLLMELGLFGLAVFGLYQLNHVTLSYAMAVVILLHYGVSYDRTWAMLRNKPYNGFVKK